MNDESGRDESLDELKRDRDSLRAKVVGLKYIVVGMLMLEAGRLLEGYLGLTAALAGPIFCAVLVVYGVFAFFNYGMRK